MSNILFTINLAIDLHDNLVAFMVGFLRTKENYGAREFKSREADQRRRAVLESQHKVRRGHHPGCHLLRNAWSDVGNFQEWYKGFISDCPNGKLTPSAFVKIYSQCFPSGNARDFCDHIFRTFDTDGNGYIDFKEFLLAISVTSSGSPEEKLNWAFR